MDIVEELRTTKIYLLDDREAIQLGKDAADEIERLREVVRRIRALTAETLQPESSTRSQAD
jgi:hypothetical protein